MQQSTAIGHERDKVALEQMSEKFELSWQIAAKDGQIGPAQFIVGDDAAFREDAILRPQHRPAFQEEPVRFDARGAKPAKGHQLTNTTGSRQGEIENQRRRPFGLKRYRHVGGRQAVQGARAAKYQDQWSAGVFSDLFLKGAKSQSECGIAQVRSMSV